MEGGYTRLQEMGKRRASQHVLLTKNYFSVQATKNKVSGEYGKYARMRGEERCMRDFCVLYGCEVGG